MIKKSKLLPFLGLLAAALAFPGCEGIQETEMKGILTVDKAQWGNDKLEVDDLDSHLTRFIYPGKKIMSVLPGRSGFYNLSIMDSRRVPLARFEIPSAAVDIKKNTFSAKSRDMHQVFGLAGARKKAIIRRDYIIKGGRGCTTTEGSVGATGSVWEVVDYRYDYELRFTNEGTGKPMGVFVARGEVLSDDRETTLTACAPLSKVYDSQEAFQ